MEGAPQPIIVKRIAGGHGHHGGSWKVAFADFATAMMAFFLLMWIMVSATPKQLGGISKYFSDPSIVEGTSSIPSSSAVQGPGGASSEIIEFGGATEMYKHKESAEDQEKPDPLKVDLNKADQIAAEAAEKIETEKLKELKEEIEKAIEDQPALKPFMDQIIMDMTEEGLRIQIVDKENRSMFDLGNSSMKDYSYKLLVELAKVIQTVPNRISISGHTDQTKYNRKDYSNWELSSDRANAARRALTSGGLPNDKVGRVVGLADMSLLDTQNPNNPTNRRISIIVMNPRTEQAIRQETAFIRSVSSSSASSVTAPNTPSTTSTETPVINAIPPAVGLPSPTAVSITPAAKSGK